MGVNTQHLRSSRRLRYKSKQASCNSALCAARAGSPRHRDALPIRHTLDPNFEISRTLCAALTQHFPNAVSHQTAAFPFHTKSGPTTRTHYANSSLVYGLFYVFHFRSTAISVAPVGLSPLRNTSTIVPYSAATPAQTTLEILFHPT